MKSASRQIFRPDAVRRYIENQQKAVLPRCMGPHTFLYLWTLLGLLVLAGSLVTWLTRRILLTSQVNMRPVAISRCLSCLQPAVGRWGRKDG
jgi:hypothetical protein